MNDMSIEDLQDWVGRSATVEESLSLATIANMNATLARDDPAPQVGDPLPLTWHWLFFNRGATPDRLSRDGHLGHDDFMPPVPLPRRMWAGNRLEVTKPLSIGRPATRVATIEDITEKTGRTGRLIFLRERSEVTDDAGGKLTDWKTLAYREDSDGSGPPPAKPAPTDQVWRRDITPDSVLLFRYSALTFNSHRIHYDREYVTGVEGYPALLVQGSLTATLLMDLLRRELPDGDVKEMNVRAMAPLYDNAPFTVNGKPSEDGKSVQLWAATNSGDLAMTVDVTLN